MKLKEYKGRKFPREFEADNSLVCYQMSMEGCRELNCGVCICEPHPNAEKILNEYLNEGGKDVSEFKKGDRVETTFGKGEGVKGTIMSIDCGTVAVEYDANIKGHTCDGYCRDKYGYWKTTNTIKLIGKSTKTQTTKENKMNKNISEVFDKTKDALLVEKHLGSQLGTTFIDGLILADKKTEVLAEAKRLEKEDKE